MAKLARFPKVVWVALGLELLERLAFYGVYVNLAVYLTDTVGIGDVENGALLGVFAAVRSWVPVVTGAASDRIGFRRSLLISFALYILAYATLFLFPSRPGAWCAVMGMALAGAFLKPVIPGTVRRHAPAEEQAMGFSLFYASVNAGSVVGKVLTKLVRTMVSLRASMLNAIAACAVALAITASVFREPARGGDREIAKVFGDDDDPPKPPPNATSPLADLAVVARQRRLLFFLFLISGYFLLIEQFYQTFPQYIVRTFGEGAPREYITLINPAAIALFQVPVGRLTRKIPPVASMALGVLIASGSMLLMGSVPTLAGACLSFFVFACAEMVLSPRYYEYVSSFAPAGKEGLYMGLAIAPLGVGGLVGGVLSGRLVSRFLPKDGPHQPLVVWGTYAGIGVVCALLIAAFALVVRNRGARTEPTSPAARRAA